MHSCRLVGILIASLIAGCNSPRTLNTSLDASAGLVERGPQSPGHVTSPIRTQEGTTGVLNDNTGTTFQARDTADVRAAQLTPGEHLQEGDPFDDPFAAETPLTVHDPWESFNENMFSFNRNLDRYAVKPAASGYNAVVPDDLQQSIDNAFHNFGILPRLVNNVLQAKWNSAGLELGRFLINSTIGIAGLFDVAMLLDLDQPPNEDLGQTLAVYGVESGPYLILPFLPPFTTRDAFGYAVDSLLSPHVWIVPITTLVGLNGGDVLNDRSLNLERFHGVEESTVDLYAAVRDAYLQRRAKAIQE